MGGYWNAHSDRDFEDRGEEHEFDALEEAEEAARTLREEIDCLKATIARLSADCNAATKWVAAYETVHGPFAIEPRMPDFMIPF